mmetsp:Transcript_146684/g.356084  ORF Transcript_146684/g.356084 Transcript_146684/m.356084 type:complete len:99 (+) Transcript_146684:517-813(+)
MPKFWRPQQPCVPAALSAYGLQPQLTLLQRAEAEGMPQQLKTVQGVPLVKGVEGLVHSTGGPQANLGTHLEQIQSGRGVPAEVIVIRHLLKTTTRKDH